MGRRSGLGVAMVCAALAAAACDAGGFTGSFGRVGGAGGTGTIQGLVTANGAGQGGISVILVNQDSTVTNGTGAFVFDSVAAGTYQVAVRVPIGFTLVAGQTSQRSVTVTPGATSGANFALQSTTTVP